MVEVINEMLANYRKQRENMLQQLYVVDGAVQACEQLLKRLEDKQIEESKKENK